MEFFEEDTFLQLCSFQTCYVCNYDPFRHIMSATMFLSDTLCLQLCSFQTPYAWRSIVATTTHVCNYVLSRSPNTRLSHKCKSDHFCYLGRVPYGIRRYSTMYVRHGTITHAGMLLSRNGTTTGRYMILAYDVMQSVRCSDAWIWHMSATICSVATKTHVCNYVPSTLRHMPVTIVLALLRHMSAAIFRCHYDTCLQLCSFVTTL